MTGVDSETGSRSRYRSINPRHMLVSSRRVTGYPAWSFSLQAVPLCEIHFPVSPWTGPSLPPETGLGPWRASACQPRGGLLAAVRGDRLQVSGERDYLVGGEAGLVS